MVEKSRTVAYLLKPTKDRLENEAAKRGLSLSTYLQLELQKEEDIV